MENYGGDIQKPIEHVDNICLQVVAALASHACLPSHINGNSCTHSCNCSKKHTSPPIPQSLGSVIRPFKGLPPTLKRGWGFPEVLHVIFVLCITPTVQNMKII